MEALKFSGRQVRAKPLRGELDPCATDDLTGAVRLREYPAAYVVRNAELEQLGGRAGFVDRGRKPKTMQLSRVLLGHDAVPYVRGSYTDARQLVRSIRALLALAAKRNDRNLYLIGVDAPVFGRLWHAAADDAQRTRANADALLGHVVPCEEVLDLLANTPVPRGLERRFVGTSRAAQLIRRLIVRAASTSEDVLILGDTGTGKEVVARCIHEYSGRDPFVHVCCAAFTPEQLDSVLFGRDDGTSPAPGFWQQAGRGMLFLDEIGGLRLDHQAKIMRALEERRIRPVGSRRHLPAPARVVASTNRDLFALVQAGQFREDLYYRLRGFTIRIPPLRAHPEDVGLLARAFWTGITCDDAATLPDDVLAALASYHWPGNARELKAVLCAVHALFGAGDIRVDHLRAVFQDLGQLPATGPLADGRGTERAIACLRHLRHVDEVIRACQVTVRPLIEQKRIAAATAAATHDILHFRLHELELLCLQPLLFHAETAFRAVYELKGRLAYFHGLLETDATEALRYWRKQAAGSIEAALTAVAREERQVVEGV